MDKMLFDDLVQSLKEAQAIAKGEAKTSRRFEVAQPDVKAVREKIGLTQDELKIKVIYDEQRFLTPDG